MGHKIITEKDFWICTMGAVPAQLQSTQLVTYKRSGEKYITVRDKATSSWIDFGCTKYMLLLALAAAILVVAAVVVGVITVATGGLGLIAIGAVAGLAGALLGAVVGGLLCGQKMASQREWLVPKSDFKILGADTITGACTMICPVGGTVKFAPHIKNWWQAISLGAANYIGGMLEGMLAGAAIGMGGAILSGGASALAAGGIRGLGQAGLQLLKSMPRNFLGNAIESVSKVGLALRGVMGAQNTLATYGEKGSASVGDFAKGVVAMETGAYDSVRNIASGAGTWQDFAGIALMFSPVGRGKREIEDGLRNRDGKARRDGEEGRNKGDEEGTKRATNQDGDAPRQEGEFEAFEEGRDLGNIRVGKLGEKAVADRLRAKGYVVLEIQNRSGHGVDIIARDPVTGNVKAIEVKANTSPLSEAQRDGGEQFVADRLRRAANGERGYGIPPNPPELSTNAETAQRWLREAPNVDYEVHRVPVDRTTGVVGEAKVTPWEPKN